MCRDLASRQSCGKAGPLMAEAMVVTGAPGSEEQARTDATVLDLPSPSPRPGWDPGGAVAWSTSNWRRLEKQLARQPLARLGVAGPRTAKWMYREIRSRADTPVPGRPSTRMTAGLL